MDTNILTFLIHSCMVLFRRVNKGSFWPILASFKITLGEFIVPDIPPDAFCLCTCGKGAWPIHIRRIV